MLTFKNEMNKTCLFDTLNLGMLQEINREEVALVMSQLNHSMNTSGMSSKRNKTSSPSKKYMRNNKMQEINKSSATLRNEFHLDEMNYQSNNVVNLH